MKRSMLLMLLAMLILTMVACKGDAPTAEATPEPTRASVEAEKPSDTTAKTATPESEKPVVSDPTAEPVMRLRLTDGMPMIQILAGDFIMGDDKSAFAPEKPEHVVTLDEYWIDRTEVSNAQYRLCVDAGVCAEPRAWGDKNFNADVQPVVVPWESARTYCEWAGGTLVTEAQWEKAARGTDGRTWTWGNEFEANRSNLSSDEDGYGFTAPVGSFPGDASPYGVMDTAGNAAEWVADWWSREYYAGSPSQNPTGPASGDQKVYRSTIAHAGGGPEKCRCTARYAGRPDWDYGFRCVFDVAPSDEVPTDLSAGALPEMALATPEEPKPTDKDPTPTTAAENVDLTLTTAPDDADPTPTTAPEDGEVIVTTTGDYPPLQSYRVRTVMTVPSGDTAEDVEADAVFEAEWDAATSASRIVVGPVEEITISNTRWTRIGDNPWMKETLTPEEQSAWEQKMALAQHWGDAALIEEEDLEAVIPKDIDLVPAQIFPTPIKAAMVFDGEENVNGVNCKRYTVDTDFDYTHDLPVIGEVRYRGYSKGTIWIAAQDGIPPVIVRSVMDQELTTTYPDREETTHPHWEHDIYDINQPVTIEKPE